MNLVISTGVPLAISGPAPLPIGTVGVSYTANMTATGGAGGYTWSATGLPTALGIGMNIGAITDTPSTSTGSPFSVKVTVTDSNSATASMNHSLIVNSLAVCEVAKGGAVTVADVQLMINEPLGMASAANGLSGDGVVNAVHVQIVLNAALSLGCAAP